MKKVTSLLILVFVSITMMAQVPQSFKYQTVARNNTGEILASQNISFRMTILQGELPGTVVYTETHATATNSVGLATLEIGRGTPVAGSFASINWSTTPIFLKTEIDPAGGSAFVEMGTSELLSVPFALEAEHAFNARTLTLMDANGKQYEIGVDTLGNITVIPTIWQCGSSFTDARDGQMYASVEIGNRCWMAENLNIGIRIDGGSNQANNPTIEKYCYNNSDAECDVYGGLYQWNEMMNYTTTAGVQGICPVGWHLPTKVEWTALTTFLGGDSVAGGKMKEAGTAHWNSPNTGATNSSGFTGLPGGYRDTWASFLPVGYYGNFWSSTEFSTSYAWYPSLYFLDTYGSLGTTLKDWGFSVRCLKDYESTIFNLSLERRPYYIGTVSGEGQYEPGEQINITAEAYLDWEFVNWTDAGEVVSEEASFIYTMPAQDVTLIANFVEEQIGFTCGDILIDTRDSKTYTTVQIGTQCWMAQNLNVGTLIAGSGNQANNATIEKYCYNNSDAQCDVYGGLYQWNEMMNYTTTAGVQGICPDGWHLPTDAEWCTVTTYLDATVNCSTTGLTGTNAGGKMKEYGTTHWISPNTGATNSSLFTALPGGYRDTGGSFYNMGFNGYWWSSSQNDASSAWRRSLGYDLAQVYRYYYDMSHGFSVRCLKDN